MNASLSLGKTSDLKQTFTFFSLGIFGLSICSFYWLGQHASLTDRWSSASIVLIHLFTIGFLMPVFLGAMTQLLPVLFGIEIKFDKIFKSLTWFGGTALVLFAYHFHRGSMEGNYLVIIFLGFFWYKLYRFIFFVGQSSWSIYKQQHKLMHLLLCLALGNLAVALFFSLWLILVHFGIPLPYFRPMITDNHFIFMVLGFFFHLLLAIANNVIPMFFVTDMLSDKKLKLAILISPLLGMGIFTSSFPLLHSIIRISISAIVGLMLFNVSQQLRNRKRKSWDPIVFLWNLFLFNALLSLVLWNITVINIFPAERLEMIIGKMIFLGCFLPLILSMLLRIIPFLIWNKLSQQQVNTMNFDVQLPHLKNFMPANAVWCLAALSELCLVFSLFEIHLPAALLLTSVALIISFLLINALKLSQNTLNLLTDIKLHH